MIGRLTEQRAMTFELIRLDIKYKYRSKHVYTNLKSESICSIMVSNSTQRESKLDGALGWCG